MGFATLNEKVTSGMRKWFLESSEKELLSMDESDRLVSDLYFYTAKMKTFMGMLSEAENMLVQSQSELKCRIKIAGVQELQQLQIAVARTTGGLGGVYLWQGKLDIAFLMLNEALAIQTTVLGYNHPDTAMTIFCIGAAYGALGKYSLAIEQFNQALAILKAALGENHPDVATTINNIGAVYSALGKHSLAIKQFYQALAIKKAALGESHPSTENTKRNLEIAQRKLLQSKPPDSPVNSVLFERLNHIQESKAGQCDNTANHTTSTGKSYSAQGKYDLAIEQFSKDLVMHRESLLGERYTADTAEIMHCIGIAYADLGKYDLAAEQFANALAIQRVVLGESHPHTTTTKRNIEFAQQKQVGKR